MLKLNSNYSDYTDETDVNYPEGKAINASASESYDGTPLRAEFMNDINAAHIALYKKVYGNTTGISGEPDTQEVSQFADAVVKLVIDKIEAHADLRGLTGNVHGATPDTAAGQIMCRDEYGRAKVSAPVDDTDIANKRWVLEAVYPVGSLYWSSKSTNPKDLFGGKWKQIKGCFVWAKGDSDTVDATGGSKTRTLGATNIPKHTHTLTHTHPFDHKHTIAHTHKVTAAGTLKNGSYSFSGRKRTLYLPSVSNYAINPDYNIATTAKTDNNDIVITNNQSTRPNLAKIGGDGRGVHLTATWQDYGTISVTTQPTFSGTEVTSGAASATYSGGPVNASGTSTTSTGAASTNTTSSYGGKTDGSTESFSIMPPYVVKYCWERTA